LDVAEQEVKVSTAGYTPLRLTLPFPVIEAKGSAKFDKRLRQLVVTLPVQAPPVTQIVPKLEDKTVSSEDTEEEDDTSNDQEEQAVPEEELKVEPLPSSVKTNVNPHARWRAENKAPEVDEFIHLREIAKMSLDDPWILKQSTMNDSNTKVEEKPATALIKNDDTPELMNDDMPPLESFSDEEDFDEIEVEKHHHDNQAEEQPIFEEEAIQRPEFIMKQTSKCISFLIQVPNVDESSIIKSFEPCNFELRFRSGETKQLFELKMKLQKEIDPQDCVVDAAKKNLVLVLRKTPQTQGIWSNVEASSEPILSTLKPLNKEKRSVQFNDKIDVQEFHKEDSSSSIQSANKSKESVMEQQQQEPESTTQETSSTPFTLAEPFVAAAIAEAEAIPAPVPTISLTQFRNKVMFELD
jgi:dynein assembly factor 2